jgi:hypothetical protein
VLLGEVSGFVGAAEQPSLRAAVREGTAPPQWWATWATRSAVETTA